MFPKGWFKWKCQTAWTPEVTSNTNQLCTYEVFIITTFWNNPSLTDPVHDFSPPAIRQIIAPVIKTDYYLLLFLFIYLFLLAAIRFHRGEREREKKKMWCTNYRELPPLVHKWMMYPERSRGPTCAEIYIVDGLIVPPAAPSLIVMSPSVVMRVSEAAAGSQCV